MKNINLNTATPTELKEALRLGPQSIRRIIKYRAENNNQFGLDDLTKVKRIKPKVRDRIIEQLNTKINDGAAKAKAIGSKGKIEVAGKAGRLKVEIPREQLVDEGRLKISFSSSGLASKEGFALNEVQMKKKFQLDKIKNLRFKLPISKHTPPGTHRTSVDVGERSFDLKIEVVENVNARVSPGIFYLTAENNEVKKTVVIDNKGNVPLEIKDPGAIPLEIDNINCRVIRGAVHEIQNKLDKAIDLQELVKISAEELAANYREAGMLRVRIVNGPVVIPPGGRKTVVLLLELPNTLKGNSYSGTIHFYNAPLRVNVLSKMHGLKNNVNNKVE